MQREITSSVSFAEGYKDKPDEEWRWWWWRDIWNTRTDTSEQFIITSLFMSYCYLTISYEKFIKRINTRWSQQSEMAPPVVAADSAKFMAASLQRVWVVKMSGKFAKNKIVKLRIMNYLLKMQIASTVYHLNQQLTHAVELWYGYVVVVGEEDLCWGRSVKHYQMLSTT